MNKIENQPRYVSDQYSTSQEYLNWLDTLNESQLPDFDFTLPEPYPENLNPESIHSWLHQFTAVSKIRQYLLTQIQQGNILIDLKQPRNSQAAILFDVGSGQSIAMSFSSTINSSLLPVVSYQDAATIIDLAVFNEKRSFENTWLHEKRTKANWSIPDSLSLPEISLLSLFATSEGGLYRVPPEELLSGLPDIITSKTLDNSDDQTSDHSPEDNIPF